jgi:hypothetical protein|tara:strand:+ start:329 stop:628 length:300 start_codon:yes stop_codon:yes gene_type:complete
MAKEEVKKKEETVEATATATAQPTAPANEQPQPDPTALSIGDLKGLMSIIDVASARGSFRAGEMAGVGTLYNKLSAFLAKVAPTEGQPGAVGSEAPKEK